MNFANAISSVESGGRYDALGPQTRTGDRAYGKYQIMGANIGPWTQEVFGRPLSVQEFVASPEAQDAVFNAKFGSYVQKYGPEGAAKAWFAGEKGMHNPNARDVLGTTVQGYAAKFNKALGPTDVSAQRQQQPMAGLPEGFVLDDTPQQVSGGLPDGFVLDQEPQPDQSAPKAPQQSVLAKALEPITSYPETYQGMRKEGAQQLSTGVEQLRATASGEDVMGYPIQNPAWEAARGLGNTVAGGLSYVTSPVNAALRTFVGKPIEENTGIPKEYSEFAASLALPVMGMTKVSGVQAPARTLKPGEQVAQSADNLKNIGAGGAVEVPRAVATDSTAVQRAAAATRNIPLAGDPIVTATERTVHQLGQKVDDVAKEYGSGSVVTAGDTAKTSILHWIGEGSKKKITDLYNRVDSLINPSVTTDLAETRAVAGSISSARQAATLPEGKAVSQVLDAVTSPKGLTYDGIKKLRTSIGEMLEGGILPEGMSAAELKQIYGALSKDLGESVKAAGGPRAEAAFNRANKYNSLVSDRRESLAKIVGADGSAPAEKVFDNIVSMASSGSRADIARLAQARKVMQPDEWNEIASGVISRMGKTEDIHGNIVFSPQKFLTTYQDKMSGPGRDLLFKSAGKESIAPYLNDIATISARFRELQKFANPSGTGQAVSGAGIGAGFMVAPLTTLSTVIGGNVLARVLAAPATVAPAAQWSRKYEIVVRSPTPANVAQLTIASRNLANTINAEFGTSVSWQDFLKSMQGAVPARADKEDQ